MSMAVMNLKPAARTAAKWLAWLASTLALFFLILD
jgi:hypothetical protein